MPTKNISFLLALLRLTIRRLSRSSLPLALSVTTVISIVVIYLEFPDVQSVIPDPETLEEMIERYLSPQSPFHYVDF